MTSWRDTMDQSQKLLVEVNPAMLKTILASAAIRHKRMRDVAQQGIDANDYTFVDAANTEAEKSYQLGKWAEAHLSSLAPDRIDAEWTTDGYGRIFRVRESEIAQREREAEEVPSRY